MNPLRKKLNSKWKSMKQRCSNPNEVSYKYYGARGIKVCDCWMDFSNFFEDMAPSYKEGLTLERINNNGNYELSNCRWATEIEQKNNRSDNRWIAFEGVTDTLTNWAKFIEVNKTTLLMRLDSYGWSLEKGLNT